MHRSKAKAGVMQRYFGDDAFVAVILTGIQGKAFPLSETAFSIFADRVDFASGTLGNSLLQNL
jgi:hypothetical protein